MKKLIRYILIAVVVLVLLLIAIPFFISPNQFRPTIEEKASAALGRQVHVGNMSLSLFSGTLSAEDLSIADDPAFSKDPFLKAKSLNVGVEIIPLIMSKVVHVTGITITEPQVTLLHTPQGKWNFSSFGAASGEKEAQPKAAGGPAPEVSIGKLELKNGRITVGSTASAKRSVYEDVNVTASNVSLTSQFPASVHAKLPGGGSFMLDGKVGPLDDKDAALSPLDAKLMLHDLDLSKTGFIDPSTGIAGILHLDSTVASKAGKAHAQGNIKLEHLQAMKGGAPASVPVVVDFDSNYNLLDQAGVLDKGTIKIGGATANLAGTYNLSGESPVLNMKISGQNMPVQDLQAVLPALGVILPKGASLQQGTLSTNLQAQGPADKLVTTGNIGLFNAKIAGFDLGSKLSALSALSGVKTGSDTSIEKLTSNLRVAPEGIRADAMELVMPALGQVTGAGTVSSNSALDFRMIATMSSAQGSVTGALGGLLGGGAPSKLQKIPFKIQGTTSDPKFIPDAAGLAGGIADSLLQGGAGKKPGQGITDALSGLFGKKKKP
jgi:AsmA protein